MSVFCYSEEKVLQLQIKGPGIPKTLDQTTQYRQTKHWPISSNRKPANTCNPYMIGHVANELRHHKFRVDRMIRMDQGRGLAEMIRIQNRQARKKLGS